MPRPAASCARETAGPARPAARARGPVLGVVGAVTVLLLSACGGSDDAETGWSIGIAQPVSHPSLDAIREGFKDAFAEAGAEVEFEEQNAQGDPATESAIAGQLADGDHDLIAPIATSQSQQVATAVAGTEQPVVFMAVTDPEDAGLVDSWEQPGASITGTSDLNPVARQLELLTEADSAVDTVGVLYASGESNSEVQVELAQEAAEELDLTLETSTVSASSEVQQGIEALAGVDAIWLPTDNVVISALESAIQFSEQQDIPLFASDAESVERGAAGAWAVDYHAIGVQSGEMALRILQDGADPATMPVETQEELQLTLNPGAAEEMGLEPPQELVDSADAVVGEPGASDAESAGPSADES